MVSPFPRFIKAEELPEQQVLNVLQLQLSNCNPMFCYILAGGTRVLLVTGITLKALVSDNCHIKTKNALKTSTVLESSICLRH